MFTAVMKADDNPMELYTLDDIGQLRKDKRTLLAVLGDPVRHSLSPAMHNAALLELAKRDRRFQNWVYLAIHLSGDDLASSLPELHAIGFHGLNLTIPHKVIALSLVKETSQEARAMGAVNTLIRTDEGYRGANTDGFGIIQAIKGSFSTSVRGKDVWLVGAGGAARGIAIACLNESCSRLTVLNRSEARLSGLIEQVKGSAMQEQLRGFCFDESPEDFEAEPLIINATSLGLKESDPLPFAIESIPGRSIVYDTTYGCRNALEKACRDKGIAYANGLSMLVWQGVRSLELWTGQTVNAEWMERAAFKELTRRQNGN